MYLLLKLPFLNPHTRQAFSRIARVRDPRCLANRHRTEAPDAFSFITTTTEEQFAVSPSFFKSYLYLFVTWAEASSALAQAEIAKKDGGQARRIGSTWSCFPSGLVGLCLPWLICPICTRAPAKSAMLIKHIGRKSWMLQTWTDLVGLPR